VFGDPSTLVSVSVEAIAATLPTPTRGPMSEPAN
jgi:hypothetical protein